MLNIKRESNKAYAITTSEYPPVSSRITPESSCWYSYDMSQGID
jgi:hypothetical protein